MIKKSNALIAQGGGPTAVINQSLVGAVLELKKYSKIKNIYGALYGIEGILKESFLNLSLEKEKKLEKIAKTPGAALFSTRDKPNNNYCKKILEILKKYNINYFFYIGGNDSANTLLILKKYAEKEEYNLNVLHIPKTIDNDLKENDHTPGYLSAAKFIIEAFIGINFEIKSLPGIYIGVVMGRNSGFLAASSSLARIFSDDGPHLIYFPEKVFSIKNFILDVKKIYDKFGFCLVCVSEGICDEKGIPIIYKLKQNKTKDKHGNIELFGGELGSMLTYEIKNKLKIDRVRYDTFGYLQRSFISSISNLDSIESRNVGINAVKYCMDKNCMSGSITIKRIKDYLINYNLVSLNKVAGKTKKMPNHFINKKCNNVTSKFKNYLMPLLKMEIKEVAKFEKSKKI